MQTIPFSSTSSLQSNKKNLRKELRAKRRSLSDHEQSKASKNLIKQLYRSQLLLRHKYIALYLGNDGELNPEPLLRILWKQKKKAYLPVIHPINKNKLSFCEISPQTNLIKNRFGIKEPAFKTSKRISGKHLSLVLMPLVAFDMTGNRMGMGGGFYDRYFSYKFKDSNRKPELVGIAHAFQEIQRLPIEPWDVPLQAVITDIATHRFRKAKD